MKHFKFLIPVLFFLSPLLAWNIVADSIKIVGDYLSVAFFLFQFSYWLAIYFFYLLYFKEKE